MRALRRGPCVKLLRPFIDEMRAGYAWRGTGLTAYRESGASSVERAAEKTDELMKHNREQQERDKAELCALLGVTLEECGHPLDLYDFVGLLKCRHLHSAGL